MSNERSERIEVLMADIREIKRRLEKSIDQIEVIANDIQEVFTEAHNLWVADETMKHMSSRIAAIEEVIHGNETLEMEKEARGPNG